MLNIVNESKDPWFNLALEEYFLRKNLHEDLICLWQNESSVIIGRHQNAAAEVDQEFAAENGIKIARRLTGGGAVYHDAGNLNYSFITDIDLDKSAEVDFKKFAAPLIEALNKYGLNAELSGRNDVTVGGRKVSGTAQACISQRLLFHGTVMYEVKGEVLERVLQVDREKTAAKGLKSVRARVTNIKPLLPDDVTLAQLKKEVLQCFARREKVKNYRLTADDIENIERLRSEKYANKDWIYGESGKANIANKIRTPNGGLECQLSLEQGKIERIKFYGDFLGIYGTEEIEKLLTGTMYDVEEVRGRLKVSGKMIAACFGNMSTEDIIRCMFGGADKARAK